MRLFSALVLTAALLAGPALAEQDTNRQETAADGGASPAATMFDPTKFTPRTDIQALSATIIPDFTLDIRVTNADGLVVLKRNTDMTVGSISRFLVGGTFQTLAGTKTTAGKQKSETTIHTAAVQSQTSVEALVKPDDLQHMLVRYSDVIGVAKTNSTDAGIQNPTTTKSLMDAEGVLVPIGSIGHFVLGNGQTVELSVSQKNKPAVYHMNARVLDANGKTLPVSSVAMHIKQPVQDKNGVTVAFDYYETTGGENSQKINWDSKKSVQVKTETISRFPLENGKILEVMPSINLIPAVLTDMPTHVVDVTFLQGGEKRRWNFSLNITNGVPVSLVNGDENVIVTSVDGIAQRYVSSHTQQNIQVLTEDGVNFDVWFKSTSGLGKASDKADFDQVPPLMVGLAVGEERTTDLAINSTFTNGGKKTAEMKGSISLIVQIRKPGDLASR